MCCWKRNFVRKIQSDKKRQKNSGKPGENTWNKFSNKKISVFFFPTKRKSSFSRIERKLFIVVRGKGEGKTNETNEMSFHQLQPIDRIWIQLPLLMATIIDVLCYQLWLHNLMKTYYQFDANSSKDLSRVLAQARETLFSVEWGVASNSERQPMN